MLDLSVMVDRLEKLHNQSTEINNEIWAIKKVMELEEYHRQEEFSN